jgi:hypothetical protein
MSYVLGFSPWLGYAPLSSVASWRDAVIAALLVQAVLAVSLIRKRQLEVLSVGTLMFFAAMSLVALISPGSAVHRWIPALSAGALAVIAGTSLIAGRPFTLAIARRSAPRAIWAHPEFIDLNRFLTSVWAAGFASSAIASGLLIGLVKNDTDPLVLANVAGFLIPLLITRAAVRNAEARAVTAGLL